MSTQIRGSVYSENCPHCRKENYFSVGDPVDITGQDIEGLECWSCHKKWLLEGVDWATLEDAYIEKGEKKIGR